MTGTLLSGRYRIDRPLGEGGMGQVHAAYDTLLERNVAIKMLRDEVAHDAQARARFRREALAAAALDHPYVCKIFEVAEDAPSTSSGQAALYIVMEYIDGRTLDVVARDGLTPRRLLEIAHEIAQALDEAHARGIVHRDLKPSNVMVTVHGHVKVLDFGLAKQIDPSDGDGTTRAHVTTAGTRLGTPAYMSPEQVLGAPLDPRSDIFSLGVVLHELASGRHPFRRGDAAEMMAAILRDPPAATEGDLDAVPGLGRLVHRMLAKACAERYQSMRDVVGELDALRERVWSTSHGSGPSAAAPAQPERSTLVARDRELAELSRHLDEMLLGRGGIVLLGGEPGVGKTRLGRELQRLARARGCYAATGQCYEQEGAPPFGPFIEMMEQTIRLVPLAVRASLGDDATHIATVVPELRRAYTDIPAAPIVPPEQQRRVVFNAYLAYLQRASQKSAAVLLLDDLHWSDDPTLQLVLHLAPHLAAMRILVIGTYRDVELDARRPFARALETLLRQRLATRIAVKRLDASGVEQMLATLGGASPPSVLVRAVHDETEGNPFFVEEVFHHLAEEGRLFDADGRWLRGMHVDQIDVPEGVRLVITRRLERLGDNARKVLAAGAVIGRSFPLDLLEAVAGGGDDDALDAVEAAVRAQLVDSERGRDARYTFVHELIRSTLISDMSLPRRQRLHAKIADAIERLRTGAALEAHTSMLAHHLYQAGTSVDAARAIRVITSAMERARQSGAFEDALALADQLLSYDLAETSAEYAAVEQTRADALFALDRPADALRAASRALDAFVACRDSAGTAAACFTVARLAAFEGQAHALVGPVQRAVATLPRERERDWCLGAAGYAGLLAIQDLTESEVLFREVCSVAERIDAPDVLGPALTSFSVLIGTLGRITESLSLAERAVALLDQTYVTALGMAVSQRSYALLISGRFKELDAFLPHAEAHAMRVGHAGGLAGVRFCAMFRDAVRSGDVRAVREYAVRALDQALPAVIRRAMLGTLAGADFLLGNAAPAVTSLEDALKLPGFWEPRDRANLCVVHAWSGAADRARDEWRRIESTVAAMRVGTMGLDALPAVACALPLIGETAACAALLPALEALHALGSRVSVDAVGPTSPQLAAAIAADAGGLADRARDHFEQALDDAERIPNRLVEPAVRLWYGRHLCAPDCDVDSRAKGAALLAEALEGFRRLRMPLHAQRAEEWLSPWMGEGR